MIGAAVAGVGYFGKIPARGDFLRRNLPGAFVEPWDDWLQRAISTSKEELGEAWLDGYLTSPIWRFVLAEGVCGEAAVAGVLMPSVDSVQRYFPLTIAALLPAGAAPFAVAGRGGAWFAEAEEAALGCLDNGSTLEDLEAGVAALGPGLTGLASGAAPGPGPTWPLKEAALDSLAESAYPALLDGILAERLGPFSLWWTSGSERIAPCLRAFPGLPPAEGFTSLLCGGEG